MLLILLQLPRTDPRCETDVDEKENVIDVPVNPKALSEIHRIDLGELL